MEDPALRASPPAEFCSEYFESIEKMRWVDTEQPLGGKRNIIIEAGYWQRKSRDSVRERPGLIGADAKFYSVTFPRSVMLARAVERNRK
jgi:hypothetical protein